MEFGVSRSWYHLRRVRAFVGPLAGLSTGLIVYQGTQLAGWLLFAYWGTIIGALVSVLLYGYQRTVRLDSMKILVPQLGELNFIVTRESQHVAWRLFVELSTRITTQPLPAGVGRVRSALTSLHTLLAFTRELLKENRPSQQTGAEPTVEQLAIAMLNSELRPFLTYWHMTLRQWESENPDLPDASWPLDERCREDLADLQDRLRQYTLNFGKLAGVPNVTQIVSASPPDRPAPTT